MGFFSRAKVALTFTEGPVTALAVGIYAVIFALVLATDEPARIPRKQGGLNITTARQDLYHIAARPHPYAVHANDDVRAFLLERVSAIARGHDFVTVDDDQRTNVSIASAAGFGVYFEGTNVLVKVDGADPAFSLANGAVLFSAHYDSVSTAPGAMDDGMGVASLIGVLEYLSKNRPRRTAVFNFNNGEEDGLHGAHAFMEHPWAPLCTTFLNLEGAASGGRPLVFRATSLSAAAAFTSSNPHINVLGADAYARGAVRSFTDYSVYHAGNGTEGSGLEGLDLSFYRGRARYHTRLDAAPHTDGGERALWAMLSAAHDTAQTLLNSKRPEVGRGAPAAYFDVLGKAAVTLRLRTLLIVDAALLALGPLVMGALVLGTVVRARRARERAGAPAVQSSAKSLVLVLLGWARFWVGLGAAALVLFALATAYVRANPFVVHAHPLLVAGAALAAAYLALVLPLSVTRVPFVHTAAPGSARQRKLAGLLQSYALSWALLAGGAAATARAGLGGSYFVTGTNAALLLAALLGLFEAWLRAGHTGGKSDLGSTAARDAHGVPEDEARSYLVRGVRFDPDGTDTGARDAEGAPIRVEGVVATEATEITPLIAQRAEHAHAHAHEDGAHEHVQYEDKGEVFWWALQMLAAVPLPVLLVSQLGVLVVAATAQTLVDGSSPVSVYGMLCAFSLLAVLPLAPFAHKLHRGLTLAVALAFVVCAAYTLTAEPFTSDAPMKVYFAQSLEVANGSAVGAPRTTLSGVQPFLARAVVPALPSTWARAANVSCDADDLGRGPGLSGCSWSSDLVPVPGAGADLVKKETKWISWSATRTNATAVRITLSGAHTRACRVYFDSRPVSSFAVAGSGHGAALRKGWEAPPTGVREVRLWSRTWGAPFALDAAWAPAAGDTEGVRGRVACLWAEYESGAAGGKSAVGGRIPAYEEVLASLPDWALATKRMEGLVEVWERFEV